MTFYCAVYVLIRGNCCIKPNRRKSRKLYAVPNKQNKTLKNTDPHRKFFPIKNACSQKAQLFDQRLCPYARHIKLFGLKL